MRRKMTLERSEMVAAIEALLFASDTPVSLETLCEVLGHADQNDVRGCVEELKEAYGADGRALQVVRVAGGYHIRTRGEYAPWVERLLRKRRKMRLSQAALETLAIVAYKQPVTKVEIESIRGVDAGGVLGTLLERNLVAIRGRSKGPGRPLLYSTTRVFLDQFGLDDLDDLPSMEELEALMARREGSTNEEESGAYEAIGSADTIRSGEEDGVQTRDEDDAGRGETDEAVAPAFPDAVGPGPDDPGGSGDDATARPETTEG
jgi:segregation and condensation protein B